MEEKTLFIKFIGNTPYTRIFDFLITGRDFDYSLTDIATKAGVSWSTLHRIFPEFTKNKVVKETRTIGRARLFKLNTDNILVKNMIKLYDSVIIDNIKQKEERKVAITA